MDDDTRYIIQFVAAQLVFVAGLIHLTLGVVNWLRALRFGFLVPLDVRWPVFVVSGAALVIGVYAAWEAENRRPFYLAGVVVLLGYVLGYFAWHAYGHRPLLILGAAAPHQEITVAWVLDHLLAGPVEFVSILVELVGAALLAVLYVVEGRERAGNEADERRNRTGTTETENDAEPGNETTN